MSCVFHFKQQEQEKEEEKEENEGEERCLKKRQFNSKNKTEQLSFPMNLFMLYLLFYL